MLDERSASWKLLLPGHRRERLLVVGLDAGGVAGLARWWREVVWVPPSPEAARAFESSGCDAREYVAHVRTVTRLDGNGADYDTIALGAWPNGERPDSAHITSLLAPDGALVSLGFAGSRLTPAEIRRIGLNGIRSYAALPASQPRLYFSTASRVMRSRGLTFHVPGSRRARRRVWASRHLSTLGLRRHLHHGAVLIAGRNTDEHARDDLTRWLSHELARPLRDLVIYAGSDSPVRKLTALAVADDARDDVVAKLADTQAAAAAVRREAEALTALAGTRAAPYVPGLLLEGAWRDCTVQVQRCIPLDVLRQVPKLNAALVRFLVELSHIGRTAMPAHKTAAWQRIERYLQNAGGGTVPAPVVRCAEQIARPEIAERHVVCHRTHGDFVPWNVRWHSGQPFLIDWEESEPSGLALSDACRFAYRQAALVGPWPGGPAMLRTLQTTCNELARRAGLPSAGIEAALRLWLLDEHVARTSAHIIEVLDAATGEQPWPAA